MNLLLDDIYDSFKQRVMEARELDAAAAEKVAQGRVWTGSEAKDLKLVDELGGLDLAVIRAKEKIGVDGNTPAYVMDLPRAPTRADQIRNLFEMMMNGSTLIGKLQGVMTYATTPQGAVVMPLFNVQ